MGTMRFTLPSGMTPDAARELERGCIVGGPDNMPWPTVRRVTRSVLTATRGVDESGYLLAAWPIHGAGHVMGARQR